MDKLTRREFLMTASAATVAATAAAPSLGASFDDSHRRQRVLVGSNTADGILAYDWDSALGELTAAGVAAKLERAVWLTYSEDRKFLFAASEVHTFDGKPTGGVVSFSVTNGELKQLSRQNAASVGTVHIALDRTGKVLMAADYTGGGAASFLVKDGKLSPAVWSEIYVGHGPNKDRQEKAHAHFVAYSPDNRYAYINDLGSDCIHIYKLDTETAMLTKSGSYTARPGAGPRTLHFHPNALTGYSVNELDSTIDVLHWGDRDGSLTLVNRVELLPEGYHGPTRACDTVITRDGKFVYFANRDNNFLYSFRAEYETGKLTPIARSNCGGKTPRNFVLDPTENWMLAANQDSNLISVFKRDTVTGKLADEGKSYPVAEPMRILF